MQRLCLAIGLAVLLSGCGTKGPLYLPPPASATKPATAATPAPTADDSKAERARPAQ